MTPAEYSNVLSSDDIFGGEDLCLSFDCLMDPCFLLEYVDGTYYVWLVLIPFVVSVCARARFVHFRIFLLTSSLRRLRLERPIIVILLYNRYHEGYLIFNVHQPLKLVLQNAGCSSLTFTIYCCTLARLLFLHS
jgi:hypothetical protein